MLSQGQYQLSASEPLLRRVVARNSLERTPESLSSSLIRFGVFIGDEISAQDFALSIDHILEQILSWLDRDTLFRCRLVSHKWRTVSTKLLKRNDFYCLNFEYSPDHRAYAQRWTGSRIYSPKFTLSKLTSFLKTTYSDGGGDAGGSLSKDKFPINRFAIIFGTLDNPQVQSFLSEFGEHIRSLYFDFVKYPRLLDQPTLMKNVETLLNMQAPNLEKFTLSANLEKRSTEGYEDTGSNSDLCELLSSGESVLAELRDIKLRKNTKLNKLIFQVSSRTILEKIISISPHLQDIELKYAHFHFLIKPVNRLHLLRRFNINTNDEPSFNFDNIEMIETALSQISQKERQTRNMPPTKFTALSICFFGIAKLISESEDSRMCFVRVINQILECSWDTLEYICFENYIGDTLRGIKWPAVLPKVGKLILNPTSTSGLDVFPSHINFNIQNTFPKLKTLHLNLEAIYFVSFSAVNYLRKRNFGPIPSVTSLHVTMLVSRIPYRCRFMTDVWLDREFPFLANELENVFPNAKTKLEIDPC